MTETPINSNCFLCLASRKISIFNVASDDGGLRYHEQLNILIKAMFAVTSVVLIPVLLGKLSSLSILHTEATSAPWLNSFLVLLMLLVTVYFMNKVISVFIITQSKPSKVRSNMVDVEEEAALSLIIERELFKTNPRFRVLFYVFLSAFYTLLMFISNQYSYILLKSNLVFVPDIALISLIIMLILFLIISAPWLSLFHHIYCAEKRVVENKLRF